MATIRCEQCFDECDDNHDPHNPAIAKDKLCYPCYVIFTQSPEGIKAAQFMAECESAYIERLRESNRAFTLCEGMHDTYRLLVHGDTIAVEYESEEPRRRRILPETDSGYMKTLVAYAKWSEQQRAEAAGVRRAAKNVTQK